MKTERSEITSKFRILGIALALAAFVATYVRLYYGVDFADESTYTAIPYSFFLGSRPFYDEISVVQFSGILATPFAAAYLWLRGSADGIILFFRHAYFAYAIFAAFLSYRFLRRTLASTGALIGACLVFTFVHLNIPSLGYNAFLSYGFLCGSLLAMEAVIAKNPGSLFFLATLFHASCIFVYPSILPASVVSLIASMLVARKDLSSKQFQALLGGFACATLLILIGAVWLLAYAGFHNLDRMIQLTHALYAPLVGQKGARFAQSYTENRALFALFPILLVLAAIAIRFRKHAPIMLLVVLFLMLCTPSFWTLQSHKIIILLGILAPVLAYRHSIVTLLIPSLLAGFIISWTSSNGPRNAPLGLFPAMLVSVSLIYAGWGQLLNKAKASLKRLGLVPIHLVFASLVVLQILNQYRAFYNDEPIRDLTTTVRTGAFQGLHTTAEKAELLTSLSEDLKDLQPKNSSVLFFNDFPAGYLLSSHRPLAPSVWVFHAPESQEFLIHDSFSDPTKQADYAIHMAFQMWGRPAAQHDTLRAFLETQGYSVLKKRAQYTILKRH